MQYTEDQIGSTSHVGLLPEEHEFLKGHRIPVAAATLETAGWIVSVDVTSLPISEREATQIACYADYLMISWYPQFYEKRMHGEFPRVAGNDTILLRKGSRPTQRNDLWFWRKISWEAGAYMPAGATQSLPAHTLLETLDIMSETSPKLWAQWKTRHPEVFQLH